MEKVLLKILLFYLSTEKRWGDDKKRNSPTIGCCVSEVSIPGEKSYIRVCLAQGFCTKKKGRGETVRICKANINSWGGGEARQKKTGLDVFHRSNNCIFKKPHRYIFLRHYKETMVREINTIYKKKSKWREPGKNTR